jgi:Family of unknown function (DUF6118)
MEPDTIGLDATDPATAAFVEMRDNYAGMTRAINSLSGEWKALEIPNYSKTLEKVAEAMQANADQLGKWAGLPAIRLTPKALSEAIIKARETARADDHAALAEATKAIDQTEKAMSASLVSARTAQEQDKRLRRVSINCLVAGMVIWTIVPGPIIRAMPAIWHFPERMAARAIGEDPWEAGQRLMMYGNPEAWTSLAMVSLATEQSRAAIKACVNLATKSGKPLRCSIRIAPMGKTPN